MSAESGRDLSLWTALLAGPIVWFISLEAKFALAPWICAFGWKPAVYLVSALSLAITIGSGLLAWSRWRRMGNEDASTRARAMAMGGMCLSAGFAIVLIAQTLPELILQGCE